MPNGRRCNQSSGPIFSPQPPIGHYTPQVGYFTGGYRVDSPLGTRAVQQQTTQGQAWRSQGFLVPNPRYVQLSFAPLSSCFLPDRHHVTTLCISYTALVALCVVGAASLSTMSNSHMIEAPSHHDRARHLNGSLHHTTASPLCHLIFVNKKAA